MGGLYSEYLSPSKVREHYNYTKETLDTQETPSRQVALALIILLCFAIVVENLLVLIAVARNSKFHSAMYLFLGNLAASDLLAGVAFEANTLLSEMGAAEQEAPTPQTWVILTIFHPGHGRLRHRPVGRQSCSGSEASAVTDVTPFRTGHGEARGTWKGPG
uniref:G-protein coupled receptors family 1 profile domain-containing protein n=1 Tax=Ursus maritimus TaxID=29073 RepID=A0A452VMC3_URSMA